MMIKPIPVNAGGSKLVVAPITIMARAININNMISVLFMIHFCLHEFTY